LLGQLLAQTATSSAGAIAERRRHDRAQQQAAADRAEDHTHPTAERGALTVNVWSPQRCGRTLDRALDVRPFAAYDADDPLRQRLVGTGAADSCRAQCTSPSGPA
jgi:hypothetical protein